MKSKVTVDNETKKEENLQTGHCSGENSKVGLLTLFYLSLESQQKVHLGTLLCKLLVMCDIR